MTRKSGYGLIALTHLARLSDGQLASAREIAEEYDIPQALLMNVMKQLSAGGYLESVRGARGGYRLAKSPAKMSMLELLESLEGPVRLADCMSDETKARTADLSECKLFEKCPIAGPVHELNDRMRQFLSELSLEDIISHTPQTQTTQMAESSMLHGT